MATSKNRQTDDQTLAHIQNILRDATDQRLQLGPQGQPEAIYMIVWNEDTKPDALQEAVKMVQKGESYVADHTGPLAYPRAFLDALVPLEASGG